MKWAFPGPCALCCTDGTGHTPCGEAELVGRDADLVLEGGGVKGIALVGAIEVLEERGYQFKPVPGTSAGAIARALGASGAPAKKLVAIIGSGRYPDFRAGSRSTRYTAGKAAGILARNGIYLG